MSDMQTQISDALILLIKVLPDADNTVGFEIEHAGKSGFRLPAFFATSSQIGGWWLGITPELAVKRLLRAAKITRVERYIRIKSYDEAKGAAA